MSSLLVNSYYPLDYFALAGVDEIQYPDTLWWSSKQRYSAVDETGTGFLSANEGGSATSEYIEIDLGRTREINFINFSALRVPADITIEYDTTSIGDGSHQWVPVERIANMPFDDSLHYDANSKNAWFDAYFYFDDPKGQLVHTRFVRIGFHRREDAWPVESALPFPYPIFVEKMRLGHYVSERIDAAGSLLSYAAANASLFSLGSHPDATSNEIRQRFVYPTNAARGGLTPSMLGAGILINVTTAAQDESALADTEYAWSLWDVTSTPVRLSSGIESVAVSQGKTWLDFYFPTPVVGSATAIYELRVQSLNTLASGAVYLSSPNLLSNTVIPGTLTFTNGSTAVATTVDTTNVVKVGAYLQKLDTPEQVYVVNAVNATTITLNTPYNGVLAAGASAVLVYPLYTYDSATQNYLADPTRSASIRVWADVGDEGRDLLGNSYRYATHVDEPKYVFDGTKAGWMSAPQPSPDAVEALYFDVRALNSNNERIYTVLDAMRVAPRTPGVHMTVYYSKEGLNSDKPQTLTQWDNLLWTPINNTYILRGDGIYKLPQAIQAAYVKLEFTALNPLPFTIPQYPQLPPVEYRRYPTWVEQQFDNANLRQVIGDWFLKNATTVQTQILATLTNPVQEFAYKENEFLAALALGQIKDAQIVNSGLIDVTKHALIDPTTSQRIFVSTSSDYQHTLLLSVDQNTILGQTVVNRYDPTLITQPTEAGPPAPVANVPYVSTINDRVGESFQNMAQLPMRFNRTCRHDYRVDEASFNKKAYFVGIDEVQFLRSKFAVAHDDPIIYDDVVNDDLLVENTWFREGTTEILAGQPLYVSYEVGDQTILDEAIIFEAFTMKPFKIGGAPARNIQVYAGPNLTGQQYFQPDDYSLGYTTDSFGQVHTTIARSNDTARLVVPKQSIPYIDVGTVIGIGVIPQQPTFDAGTAVGIAGLTAIASSQEGPFVPNYGTGTEGGLGGTYGNLAGTYADAATAAGHGVASPSDAPLFNDAATVSGTAGLTAIAASAGSYNGGPNA